MNEVFLGGNNFRDCTTLIAFGGQPLLGVSPRTGDIELHVPARTTSPSGTALLIEGSRASGSDPVLLRLAMCVLLVRHHRRW